MSATRAMGAGLAGGAVGGLLAGALDGGLRFLGVDPSVFFYQVGLYGFGGALEEGLPRGADLPGLLGCWLWTAGAGYLIGAGLGMLLGLVLWTLRRGWQEARLVRASGGLVLGLWLGMALFWWTRPVIYSGLSMTDPRRLAAGAGLMLVGLLAGLVLAGLGRRLPAGLRAAGLPVGAVCCLVGGAYLFLGNESSGERGQLNPRNRDLPNVVVIVVDALRQDVLGCYGHPEIQTPHMDRLAAEGVLFEEAFAQAPFTWPSFGSFLTGKYPRRHGLVKMDPSVRMGQNVTLPFYLAGAQRQDGTRMQDGDFTTAAFMTGTVSHGSGLLRGFDYYYEAIVGHDLVDVRNRWSRFRSGLLPSLIKNKITQRFDDGVVASVARDWMVERADRRFLSLVHLYSTHTTYAPSQQYLEPYVDPAYDGPVSSFSSGHVHAIQQGDWQLSEADLAQVRALYAGGVTQADAHVGNVLRSLEEQGILDDTIVVLTSDHGESLGEDGYWEHNWMVQSNLRIPLILRYPKGLPQGVRVGATVDSIDLVPTVLDLMGLEPLPSADDLPADLDPRSPEGQPLAQEAIDGKSLVPLATGEAASVRSHSFAENGPYRSVQDERWKLVLQRDLLDKVQLQGALLLPEPVQPEYLRLFDLEADPDERQNLSAKRHDKVRELVGVLREYDAKLPIRSDLVELSKRDFDQTNAFRGLGYTGDEGESEDTRTRAGMDEAGMDGAGMDGAGMDGAGMDGAAEDGS